MATSPACTPKCFWLQNTKVIAVLLALVSALPYLPSMSGKFCYDDKVAVGGNPDVVLPNVTLFDIFTHDYWGNDILRRRTTGWTHDSWRPLVTLTFRLNHKLGGLDTTVYHWTNVFINALASVVAYCLLLQLYRGSPDRHLRAAIAGLLFALHPIHSETVANITSRADPMAAIPGFASVWLYLGSGNHIDSDAGYQHQRGRPVGRRKHCACGSGGWAPVLASTGSWFVCMALVVFATMCKETSIVLPAVMAVVELCMSLGQVSEAVRLSQMGGGFVKPSTIAVWLAACWSAVPLVRPLATAAFSLLLYYARIVIMSRGYSLQSFANEMHNPLATIEDTWSRWMAKAYVQSWALGSLVLPIHLSHEHNASRPVVAWGDYRNGLTVLVYGCLLGMVCWSLWTVIDYPSLPAAVADDLSDKSDSRQTVDASSADAAAQARDATGSPDHAAFGQHQDPGVVSHVIDGQLPEKPSEIGASPASLTLSSLPPSSALLHTSVRLLTAVAWTLITYLPASHALLYVAFVVAERTMYLPSLGACMAMGEVLALMMESAVAGGALITGAAVGAAAVAPSSPRRWPRRVGLALLSLLALHYVLLSYTRNMAWRDEDALLSSNIALYPSNNGMSMYGLGAVRMYQGRVEEAERYLRQAANQTTLAEPHILLGQLHWRHKNDYEAAIGHFQFVEHTSSPRKEILQNLGLLLMMTGKAPTSNEAARQHAEYCILAGHKAHGYPMGHPNIGGLASNAACTRLLSEPWRYYAPAAVDELFTEALGYRHHSRPITMRNAAAWYAIQGQAQRALDECDEGIRYVADLRAQQVDPEAVKQADEYTKQFQLLQLSITTQLPLVVQWSVDGPPLGMKEVEARLATIGVECTMELHWW